MAERDVPASVSFEAVDMSSDDAKEQKTILVFGVKAMVTLGGDRDLAFPSPRSPTFFFIPAHARADSRKDGKSLQIYMLVMNC